MTLTMQRTATLLLLLVVLLLAAEFAAEATHRATEACVNCSSWNWFCRFGNWLAKCSSGH